MLLFLSGLVKGSDQTVRKFIEKLPLLWLIVGFIAIGSYFYGYKVLLRSDDQIQQIGKVSHPLQSIEETEVVQKEKAKQADFDESQIQPVSPTEYASAQLNYEKIINSWGIGALFIPSSDIHSKILMGMSNDNLMVGLGTYYPNQELGKGNYVMMAHNLVQGGGVLRDLPKTTDGSIVYATDFTNIYEYVVNLNETVNQSEGHLLDVPKKNQPALMTIFRCEGGLHTPNRALIQAVLHKSYPADEGSHAVKENLGLEKAASVPSSQITKTLIDKPGRDRSIQDSSESRSTEQKSGPEEKKSGVSKVEQKNFLFKKPVYNNLDTYSIQLFRFFNSYPIVIGIVFILGMLFFVYISNRRKRVA